MPRAAFKGLNMPDLFSSLFTVNQQNANVQFSLHGNPVTGQILGGARDVTGNAGVAFVTGQGTAQNAALTVGPFSGMPATGFYSLSCDPAGNVTGHSYDVANPAINVTITMVSRP